MKNSVRILFVTILAVISVISFSACGKVDTSPVGEDEIAALYTSPADFKGRTFEFTGKVLDVESSGNDLYLQVYQDIKNYENNTIVTLADADISVKSDDFVKVSGSVAGEFTGENMLGGEVKAPQITATSVEKIDAMEAFPAKKTVEVKKTVKRGKYKATISKVDFTDDEMRIYLKVENGSSSTFDNYPDQGAVVQNGKQYECEWSEYYPSPITSLKSGASSESVIAFKGLDQSSFTYSFEGYDDISYDTVDFSFDIKIK